MLNNYTVKHHLTALILQELQPRRLLPSLMAGLIASVIAVIISAAFATLIFSGELSDYISAGVNFMLFASIIIGGFVALTSSLPGLVAGLQDSTVAILAIVSTTIVKTMPPTATSQETFFTVVAAIALSTILTGIIFFGLGQFRLGNFIRFIPYPVIGGFLAGTGLLLVLGALSVMVEPFGGIMDFPLLLKEDMLHRWLPGFIVGVLLLIVLNRFDHPLTMPAMLLGTMVVFHAMSWVFNFPILESSAGDTSDLVTGGLENSLILFNLQQVHWLVLLKQTVSGIAVAVVSIIALLLNATSIELATNHNIDLNRELKMTGIANILAGLGGGIVGSHVLSDTTLVYRMGARGRLVGLVLAIGCIFVLVAGDALLLALFPKPVLGGLLLFLGLDFLVTWVYKAWFKLPLVDYGIVILILLVITLVGFLEGIGLGIVLSVILFVIEYSRTNVVRHTLSGATCQSNFHHPRLYRQLLRRKGDWIYILELQGFIFFGTAYTLLEQVHWRIKHTQLPAPRFVVLDFRRVSGLDTSAAFSFARMKQLAIAQDVVLVFTHLSSKMQRQLEKEVLRPEDSAVWRIFPDLDRGVEWCEAQTIQTLKSVGITHKTKSTKQRLQETLPSTDKFDSLFSFLAEEGTEQTAVEDQLFDMTWLIPYMEQMDVKPGYTLIRQGELAKGLYYIETGQVTVQLEQIDGQIIRLSTMGEETVVGELGFYLGTPASATVIVDQPGTIYFLSTYKLTEMENSAPQITAAFHKFMAQRLSERLLSANDRLQALLQ